jgi:RHS repeat-associated protein
MFLGWTTPALALAGLVYFGTHEAARSQSQSGSTVSFSSPASTVSPVSSLPDAPAQVKMPEPPPIKYFAGLEEPLVATGPVSEQEKQDLDTALNAFHELPAHAPAGSDFTDFAQPLLAFIDAHPGSNWNAALYMDLGFGYYRAGYFTRVYDMLAKAWQFGRSAQNPMAHIMIDRAVGELARMHARVGRADELDALLKDIGNRPIGGPATELLQGAREALWTFRNDPGKGFLCGPRALRNVLLTLNASPEQVKIADDARSGPHGFTLDQLAALTDQTGLSYTLIHREPGQPIPVPSIVNWNVHHYAAIVSTHDGLYDVIDPTFGDAGGYAVTPKQLDAESSGYFLVPETAMTSGAGWRTVAKGSDEAKAVYGMGVITIVINCPDCANPNSRQLDLPGPQTTQFTSNEGPTGSSKSAPSAVGMPEATTKAMNVDLSLNDAPVGYTPQIGLSAMFQLSYSQRTAFQPATFATSNLSPKWSHNWMSNLTDNPANTNNMIPVTRVGPGAGGFNYYPNYNPTYGSYPPELWNNPYLAKTPITGQPSYYKRSDPDGTVYKFALSDGATTAPRKWFLTTITDPQGNTTTINYDSSFRITTVVDAMGRSTTFTYGLSSYPLLITQVTDPFGRAAQFTYDTSQRLSTATDALGITTSFTYSTTEPTFITSMTTPYGTTTYNNTPDPNDTSYTLTRSLTVTDPMGYTDYTYFYPNPSIVPASDASGTIPTGMYTQGNSLLNYRNTFHWGPHAFALGCTLNGSGVVTAHDFGKSTIFHWTHYSYDVNSMGPALESIKRPLENRVWIDYPGSYGTNAYYGGTINSPSAQGRVVDSGASQVSKAGYGTSAIVLNPLLSRTDAVGRTTQYNYATNNIDLLTVKQLTTSPSTYTTIATYGSYTTSHRPQTYTDAAGKTWNYTYTSAGQIKTVTDPNSNVTTYNYDSAGRLSTIVNANSQTVLTLTYDSADRILTRTDSQGYTLTYAYDNLDRITSITYPDTTTDLYDYNFQSGPYVGTPSLELRKYTDRLGRVTLRDYDANRRLTSVTEPISTGVTRTTSFDYYEDGTLKNLTDANGNVTHWDIDVESRPTSKTYAYGTGSAKTETYTYETTNSRLKSITDALGQVKTFTYAPDDRITGITYTSSVNTTPNVTFAYDAYFPRLTSMTDGTGTTTYSYTAIGTNGALKLSSISGPYSNDAIGLTYDALGRLSGRTITGGNETFGYDAISRLTSHATPLGSFTYGYLGETGQTTSRSVTNGGTSVSTSWGYDTNANDRRLISISNSGVTRSFTLGYTSGAVTNPYDILSITDTAATGHPFSTQTHSYTYDNVDRLLTATEAAGTDSYAYDKLDNATTVTVPGIGTTNPTYNVNNQLATWGSNTYSYDSNGNTLSGDGARAYKWDAENRLIEIDYVGTSNKTVFTYNGVGERRIAAETISGTTTMTRYLWCLDTQQLRVGNGSRICQSRDGSDSVLKRYLDEGEYDLATSQKLVYMPDQIGSVRDVLDATTGTRVASYDHSPYGIVTQSNVTNGAAYQYAELFYHAVSGLNLSSTRAIDGVTGRWLNRDPIREGGGFNLYAYVGGNPINVGDPEGLLGEYACVNHGLPEEYCSPQPPPAFGNDCASNCLRDSFGPLFDMGAGLFGAGGPWVPKKVTLGGSATGMSPISRTLWNLPWPGKRQTKKPYLTPTWPNPTAESDNIAVIIGRWAPIGGAGGLLLDYALYRDCLKKCQGKAACGEE